MLITDETFLASILLSIPFIRMFQKLGVNLVTNSHSNRPPGPALSPHQKPPFDRAA